MKAFTDGHHCHARVHCGTCRSREEGRGWRESLAKAFELPPGAPDFDCPHGLPWGFEGAAPAITTEPTYAEVLAVCVECPEAAGCAFMHRGRCGRQAIVSHIGEVCPAMPPRWGPVSQRNEA